MSDADVKALAEQLLLLLEPAESGACTHRPHGGICRDCRKQSFVAAIAQALADAEARGRREGEQRERETCERYVRDAEATIASLTYGKQWIVRSTNVRYELRQLLRRIRARSTAQPEPAAFPCPGCGTRLSAGVAYCWKCELVLPAQPAAPEPEGHEHGEDCNCRSINATIMTAIRALRPEPAALPPDHNFQAPPFSGICTFIIDGAYCNLPRSAHQPSAEKMI